MGIDHSTYRGDGGCGPSLAIYSRSTIMQVLRSPALSWLYPVFSVFLWLWTVDFTHGVLKGEEININYAIAALGVTPNCRAWKL